MSDPFTLLSTLPRPDGAALKTGAKAALDMVANYRIDSDEEYTLAGEELVAIKSKAKRLEEQRTSITGPLNQTLKAVNDLFREPAGYLEQAEKAVKNAMVTYAQAKEAQAEAARREAEARIAEARRQAEESQRAAEAAAAAGNIQQAEAAAERALTIEMEAANSAPVVAAAPKLAGVSKVSVKHKARVVDIRAFLAFALREENDALLGLIGINESGLNKLASAMGPAMKYPGVEVYQERSISARAA
jgi:ATPase subunit of ABC transporter with duplicated ATPase domains